MTLTVLNVLIWNTSGLVKLKRIYIRTRFKLKVYEAGFFLKVFNHNHQDKN